MSNIILGKNLKDTLLTLAYTIMGFTTAVYSLCQKIPKLAILEAMTLGNQPSIC
jgi:hypothetical protein